MAQPFSVCLLMATVSIKTKIIHPVVVRLCMEIASVVFLLHSNVLPVWCCQHQAHLLEVFSVTAQKYFFSVVRADSVSVSCWLVLHCRYLHVSSFCKFPVFKGCLVVLPAAQSHFYLFICCMVSFGWWSVLVRFTVVFEHSQWCFPCADLFNNSSHICWDRSLVLMSWFLLGNCF